MILLPVELVNLIFKTLLKVIRDEEIKVECLRIPTEPFAPYILTPSLYTTYSLSGIIKQWTLNILGLMNKKELIESKINTTYFMGIMYSGKMTEEKIKKLMPYYLKLADKGGNDIEVTLHPGYVKTGEALMDGYRKSFKHFYVSPWRKKEYDTLTNFK